MAAISAFVMPGLVPGIDVFERAEDVDGRDKPGHDARMKHYFNLRAACLLDRFRLR